MFGRGNRILVQEEWSYPQAAAQIRRDFVTEASHAKLALRFSPYRSFTFRHFHRSVFYQKAEL
jgi:hypothetical protein